MSKKDAHHGGAWKVAYADFVTAMMALFLVLWLTSQDEKIKQAVERSFRNPFASLTKESTGIIPNKDVQAVQSKDGSFDTASAVELNFLRKISDELLKLEKSDDPQDDQSMKIELDKESVRVSVFDRAKRPIFERESAVFTEYGRWVFSTLAWTVSSSVYSNLFRVELEGHTEAGHTFKNPAYGAWELSTERANAARRRMVENGLHDDQIWKVAGYADTLPIPDCAPQDERNRRVTLMLKVKTGAR